MLVRIMEVLNSEIQIADIVISRKKLVKITSLSTIRQIMTLSSLKNGELLLGDGRISQLNSLPKPQEQFLWVNSSHNLVLTQEFQALICQVITRLGPIK